MAADIPEYWKCANCNFIMSKVPRPTKHKLVCKDGRGKEHVGHYVLCPGCLRKQQLHAFDLPGNLTIVKIDTEE